MALYPRTHIRASSRRVQVRLGTPSNRR
jgi:hypothetical protein